MEYKNFRSIHGYENFMRGSQTLLIHTLENFFSAKVRLHFEPLREILPMYGIDILNCVERKVYDIDKNSVMIVSHVNIDDISYLLAIVINFKNISSFTKKKIFEVLASSISNALHDSQCSSFRSSVLHFDHSLIHRTIAKYVSKGKYDSYKIFNLMSKFNAIRTTTFEGKYFSTGLIITKSIHNYRDEANKEGGIGSIFGLHFKKDIYDEIDTRFWYLADGHSTFFLTDTKKDIHYMFVYKNKMHYDANRIIQSKAIKGRDLLFKTECGREFSIITSKSIEFIYQENTWRYRDYKWLQKQIMNFLPMSVDVYNALIHYVLFCSKHDISSIIWMPKDLNSIDNYVSVKHAVSNTKINIQDPKAEGLIIRLLSSDGATIISSDGAIKYYGAIAELKDVKAKTPKGTGESAASILAKNGMSFKISQDAVIKIFMDSTMLKL